MNRRYLVVLAGLVSATVVLSAGAAVAEKALRNGGLSTLSIAVARKSDLSTSGGSECVHVFLFSPLGFGAAC